MRRFLLVDCDLGLTEEKVRRAISMSQMTVVYETDEKTWSKYQQLVYVEFLEMFARVATIIF